MTPNELFDTTIPALLTEHPEKAKELKGTFQLNVGNSGWFLDAANGVCKSGTEKADCTISIAEPDFQRLAANPAAWLMVLGKIKIEGNKSLAMSAVPWLLKAFKSE